MRSPEHKNTYNTTKKNQNYDYEISKRQRAPGAFTILPPEESTPLEPPTAPQPYRYWK